MSITDPTSAELLTAVNAAILSLLSGKTKSYSIGDRTYVYRDISDLRELRKSLVAECRATGGTIRLGDIS